MAATSHDRENLDRLTEYFGGRINRSGKGWQWSISAGIDVENVSLYVRPYLSRRRQDQIDSALADWHASHPNDRSG